MRFFNVMGQASLCQTEAKSSPNARIVQIAQRLRNALLLCQLRVPALLQYLGHQSITGVDLIVLRKGPLGFVARLLQLPLQYATPLIAL